MAPPVATFEDSTLIKLALEGQAECFTVLVDRHLVAVRRRIRSMVRNAGDADDLLQEVLLKVWRRLSTFRSESSFRTWMTRVAMNEVFQLYRRQERGRLCQSFGDFNALPSHGESPLQTLARVEVTQVVRSAVAGLPAKYSQVLVLQANSRRLHTTWGPASVKRHPQEPAETVWRRHDRRGDFCAAERYSLPVSRCGPF